MKQILSTALLKTVSVVCGWRAVKMFVSCTNALHSFCICAKHVRIYAKLEEVLFQCRSLSSEKFLWHCE